MARKWRVFFRAIQPFLKWRPDAHPYRGRLAQFSIILVTVLVCTVVYPAFAKAPTANSVAPSLASSTAETQKLVQQGKTFYDVGQFAEAVKVLQQAALAFESQGDRLRQAMTLSNLALGYQQLGQWSQAERAITDSLNLLGYPMQKGRGAGRHGRVQNLEALAQVLTLKDACN